VVLNPPRKVDMGTMIKKGLHSHFHSGHIAEQLCLVVVESSLALGVRTKELWLCLQPTMPRTKSVWN
jgi:hypothetical protein